MHRDFPIRARPLAILLGLLWGIFVLIGCEIEGGSAPVATPDAPPLADAAPTAVPPTPTPTDELRIGMVSEPTDLLPYYDNAIDEQRTMPVVELLFPAPLLPVSYEYTTTGTLERVPSFANGDVAVQDVQVYLDSSGEITSTATANVTTTKQIVVTYRWNPTLRWSDGITVTAADSVFAYNLARNGLLSEKAAQRAQLLDRYEQVDDHTTQAYLNTDFAVPPEEPPEITDPSYVLTYWTPLPSHLLSGATMNALAGTEYAMAPVGYGPYVVAQREEGRIQFVRNPYYGGTPPMADDVTFVFAPTFDMLRTGVLDGRLDLAITDHVSADQFSFLARDKEMKLLDVIYTPGPVWEHIDFNLDKPVFPDIRIRRALIYGTNRQKMIDALFGGHMSVLHSWIVPEHWASVSEEEITRYPYDPDHARRLLEEAGFTDSDNDGIREYAATNVLTLTLLTTENTPLRERVAEMFQQDMQNIGVGVGIQKIPVDELYSAQGPLFRREFQMVLFSWMANPDPGGLALWSCRAVPSEENNWQGNNFAGWCFREADKAIRTAATSHNREERREAYLTQQQVLTREAPFLPLFQRPIVTLHTTHLQGLQPDPTAPITWNIGEWWWK